MLPLGELVQCICKGILKAYGATNCVKSASDWGNSMQIIPAEFDGQREKLCIWWNEFHGQN